MGGCEPISIRVYCVIRYSCWNRAGFSLNAHDLAMRFSLIDRIVEVELGAKITAEKNVSMSEEYLQDHFPLFPVLPGVFMLEAATQASAWLIRLSENFQHSMVLLTEANNIKYANFVGPGHTLRVTSEITRQDERFTKFKIRGMVNDTPTLSGRLVLERFNLADTDPAGAAIDRYVNNEQQNWLGLVYPNRISDSSGESPRPMDAVASASKG